MRRGLVGMVFVPLLGACGGGSSSHSAPTTIATTSSTAPSFLKADACAKWRQVKLTDPPILVRVVARRAADSADQWEAAGGPKGIAAAMRLVAEGVFANSEPPGFRDAYVFARDACR